MCKLIFFQTNFIVNSIEKMYIYVLSKTCNNKRKLKIIAIVDTINEETFINKK